MNYTNHKQSEKLVELGLDPTTADKVQGKPDPHDYTDHSGFGAAYANYKEGFEYGFKAGAKWDRDRVIKKIKNIIEKRMIENLSCAEKHDIFGFHAIEDNDILADIEKLIENGD